MRNALIAYPVFAFDIGAIARRLREIGYADTLMPMALLNSPEKINAFLLQHTAPGVIDYQTDR